MHKQFIKKLVCPKCHSELEWQIREENHERVINADISCKSCNAGYEVVDEIAVFLTPDLYRNDLWVQGESGLEKYFREHPIVYEKLMNTPEEELNGADYWYKSAYFEINRDFEVSTKLFEKAFSKIYTVDYIEGWMSQLDFVSNTIGDNEPVVDIASGKGYLVEKLLREKDNYIIATDFSPTILIRNKKYYQFLGLYENLSLMAFDARRTPFRDCSIPTLTSNMGIQNIENPGAVLNEMQRITQKRFMSIMHLYDEKDTVHMNALEDSGQGAFSCEKNVVNTYNDCEWPVELCNSYKAKVKPTPVGVLLEGALIDGMPLEDTVYDLCVACAVK